MDVHSVAIFEATLPIIRNWIVQFDVFLVHVTSYMHFLWYLTSCVYSTRRIYAYRTEPVCHNGTGVDKMNINSPLEDWITKEQFVKAYPALNLSQVKYLIRSRKDNGLSKAQAVAKVGGRVLIHKKKFADWVSTKVC